jgi:hypothetical protein
MATITYVGVLTVTSCGVCRVRFAMPERMLADRQNDGQDFWCPNGHRIHFFETENRRLARDLAAERARRTHAEDQLEATERSRRAVKGHLTRIRNRIASGVCPWCQRSFSNVRAHVSSQHPDHADAMTEALA